MGMRFFNDFKRRGASLFTPHTTKKKKLQVPPGRSESVSELSSTSNTSASIKNSKHQGKDPKWIKTTKTTIWKRKQTLEDSTSEENDVFSLRSGGDSDISLYNSDGEHLCQTKAKSAPTPAPVAKDDLEIGNFVLVKWNEKEYPGVILAIEADVDCMEPALKAWRWPKNEDVVLYKFEDVVMKI